MMAKMPVVSFRREKKRHARIFWIMASMVALCAAFLDSRAESRGTCPTATPDATPRKPHSNEECRMTKPSNQHSLLTIPHSMFRPPATLECGGRVLRDSAERRHRFERRENPKPPKITKARPARRASVMECGSPLPVWIDSGGSFQLPSKGARCSPHVPKRLNAQSRQTMLLPHLFERVLGIGVSLFRCFAIPFYRLVHQI